MLFFTPAASMRSRIPPPVIVRPSMSAPMWAWASKTSTPACIFACTQDQIEAIAPPVSASMLCSICKVTADLRPTTVKCYQGGFDVAQEGFRTAPKAEWFRQPRALLSSEVEAHPVQERHKECTGKD